MKKSSKWILIVTMIVGFLGWQSFRISEDNHSFEVIKNLEIFTELYKKLNGGYVEELDPGVMMDRALDGMLKPLDPYTRYISEADIESQRLNSAGKYQGFGARLKKIGEYTTIVEVHEGGPAQIAGMIPGDKIIKVENIEVQGMNTTNLRDVINSLPTAEVSLTVKRLGQDEPLIFNLDRKQIKSKNVPYHGLIGEDIGYVVLTTFTADAGKNVRGAIADLKTQQPDLAGVVLDLRDNGGGLLREAINLSNIFVPQGKLVVSTRNKLASQSKRYTTPGAPLDLDIPLAVLINGRSASASEIVAGVIQDYDRGVLVGKRSFGKGLVQVYKPLKYGTQLKMTISKYYIPSGRCIQSSEYGEDGEPIAIDDDRRNVFKTTGGREVLDGGGVSPDIAIADAFGSPYIKHLEKEDVFMFYATKVYLDNPEWDIPSDYAFDDIEDFKAFVESYEFANNFAPDGKLQALQSSLEESYETERFSEHLESIRAQMSSLETGLIDRYSDEITRILTREVVSRYKFRTGVIENGLHRDEDVLAAVQVLKDTEKYNSILGK